MIENISAYFKRWLEEREEKKAFTEMWKENLSKDYKDNNPCIPYHCNLAYQLYKLEKRVIELEKGKQ